MQNRLIQYNIDTFAAAEIDRSRSNSNCSSTSSSFKSSISQSSPNTSSSNHPTNLTSNRRNHQNQRSNNHSRAMRVSSWGLRSSSSLQSIQDVDVDISENDNAAGSLRSISQRKLLRIATVTGSDVTSRTGSMGKTNRTDDSISVISQRLVENDTESTAGNY